MRNHSASTPPPMPPAIIQWYADEIGKFEPLAGLDRWCAADLTTPVIFGVKIEPNPVRSRPIALPILLTLAHNLAGMVPVMAAYARHTDSRAAIEAMAKQTAKVLCLTTIAATGMGWYIERDRVLPHSPIEAAALRASIISDGQKILRGGIRLATIDVVLPAASHPQLRANGMQAAITPMQRSILTEMLGDVLVQALRAQLLRPKGVHDYHQAVLDASPPAPAAWPSACEEA